LKGDEMTTKKKTTTKKKEKSIWETLSKIDCSEHIEKKGGFNYLSWAWAWGILMEHYPDATFFNHLNIDGFPCFFDVNGNAMVRVTLTILEQEHTEDFPVLNYKNQAIKDPDSFAVNTALKRCLVKSMAYFGLGHYIYAGEDLPPQEETPFDRKAALEIIKTTQKAKDNFNEDEGRWTESILLHFDKLTLTDLADDELLQVTTKISNMEKKQNG
tara:strand:+ start:2486 stop:3127 length:642 start_codon:yes stop_codon:yes gene_type:complete